MTSLPCRPRPHAVISPDEVVAHEHGIVPIRYAPDHLAIDKRSPVPAPIVCAQWIRERARRVGQEGRGKGTRRSLGVQSIACLKVKRRLGLARCTVIRDRRQGASAGLLGLARVEASRPSMEVSRLESDLPGVCRSQIRGRHPSDVGDLRRREMRVEVPCPDGMIDHIQAFVRSRPRMETQSGECRWSMWRRSMWRKPARSHNARGQPLELQLANNLLRHTA